MPPRVALRLPRPSGLGGGSPAADSLVSRSRTTSSPTTVLTPTSNSIPSFLLPFLHTQTRNASILSELADRPGAYNRRIRRGRGPASGNGGKSGRGSDGQKQHGSVPVGFNGGQTPEHIVHGKYGFRNLHATEMVPINLDRIQAWIDQKRLDPTAPITLRELHTSRALHGTKDGVKLLANGAAQLKTPINIIVSKASRSAIAAVEAVGGTVTTRFYTPQAIRRIKQGVMHPFVSLRWDPVALKAAGVVESGSESEATADADADAASSADAEDHYSLERRAAGMGYSYRLPDPTSRKDLEYYRDPANRGYLSHTVAEGHGPSLYFKPPVSEEELKALRKKSGRTGRAGKAKQENKLW